MKVMICSSKHFYHLIPPVVSTLEKAGHTVTFPNMYEDPLFEEKIKMEIPDQHPSIKARLLRLQSEKVASVDAILVLNYDKNAEPNYTGGSTFPEIFKAFEPGKKI